MDLLTKKDDFLSMVELINDSHGCTVDSLPKIDSRELAVIIFTSGTLGERKVSCSVRGILLRISLLWSV